jgi:hypothetical protein
MREVGAEEGRIGEK